MYGWHCESVQSLVGSRPAGEGLRSPHLFQVKALREVEMRVGARAGDYIENPIGVIEPIACGTPGGYRCGRRHQLDVGQSGGQPAIGRSPTEGGGPAPAGGGGRAAKGTKNRAVKITAAEVSQSPISGLANGSEDHDNVIIDL